MIYDVIKQIVCSILVQVEFELLKAEFRWMKGFRKQMKLHVKGLL